MAGDFVRMPSGLMLPDYVAERELKRGRLLKGMDFFAGAGGFSCGFIQAGYEVVAAAEWEPDAVMTYMVNLCRWGEVTMHFVSDEDRDRFEKMLKRSYKSKGIKIVEGEVVTDGKTDFADIPLAGSGWIAGLPRSTPGVKHIFVGDVRKLTGKRILQDIGMAVGELDVVMGGPPCQGYSTAGKRNIADPRNNLVFEYARLICELKPKTMVMEEVPAILTMVTPEGVNVIDQFCRILEAGEYAGYEAFRNAIKAIPGAVGVLRGDSKAEAAADSEKPAKKAKAAKAAPKPKAADDQSDLFSSEAA